MRTKIIFSTGLLFITIILAAGVVSCSNPDQVPQGGIIPSFEKPMPPSPIGLVITDPVFRQIEPDPLVRETYKAANLTPMTSDDLWAYFTSASQRIDITGTRITNAGMVSRLVGIANKGVQINIVCEKGYFNDSEATPFISQLSQTGHVTLVTDEDDVARQMHSRYAIIDDHIVVASSGDLLDRTFNTAVNNTLIFDNPRTYTNGSGPAGVQTITDAFLFDFDQMFNQGKFGGDKVILNNHTFNIGVNVEVYFGPNDDLLTAMVDEVNNMQSNMQFAINQVTDSLMLNVVLPNFAQIGFYDGPSNPGLDPETDLLNARGFWWTGYNSLNHKFILIDLPADLSTTIDPVILDVLDPVVITGSANWTHNGLDLNDEQLLIIHDLTLGFEYAVEMAVLSREAGGFDPVNGYTPGYGVVFGKVATNKDVPLAESELTCDSLEIVGGVFLGDGGTPTEDETNNRGYYALFVPSGFLRNIQVLSLGDASGAYLLPDPIWGDTQPNEGWNFLPGSSYEANFYVVPAPTQTGTGGT